jgi:hypothetical protein
MYQRPNSLLCALALFGWAQSEAHGQITITSDDCPIVGDAYSTRTRDTELPLPGCVLGQAGEHE